jgi:hypothetical protein
MDELTQCRTDLRGYQKMYLERQKEYSDMLQAISRKYDDSLEQKDTADTEARRSFYSGMNEAYKTVLEILTVKVK